MLDIGGIISQGDFAGRRTMKRIVLPGIAAIGMGLAALAACFVVTAGTEAGGIYHNEGSGASASFYSEEGTVATYVDVYASDYVDQSPRGRPHKDSSASICIRQQDSSTGEVLLDACGWTSLPEPAFQIDKRLKSASLDATITVCSWVPPTPPPTTIPPTISPTPFTMTAMAVQQGRHKATVTPTPPIVTPTPIATPEYCGGPVLITTFTGTVTVDGQPAPDGTTISAIGGDGLTWATTTTSGGSYAINVPDPVPVTPPCFPGGMISFQCDGASAAETGLAGGGSQELNLTCGPLTPITPTVTPTPPVPPACLDVSVDLKWIGTGELSRRNSHTHYHSPEFKDNWHCNGAWRAATATGSVSDGVTNFTPAPATWAEMSTGKCREVTID
jgi:hypothetical protein